MHVHYHHLEARGSADRATEVRVCLRLKEYVRVSGLNKLMKGLVYSCLREVVSKKDKSARDNLER